MTHDERASLIEQHFDAVHALKHEICELYRLESDEHYQDFITLMQRSWSALLDARGCWRINHPPRPVVGDEA